MFSRIGVRTGFTLVFTAVMLIMVLAIYWFLHFFVLDAYEQLIIDNSKKLNIELAEQIDLYLNDLNQLTKNFVSNQTLMENMRQLDRMNQELSMTEMLYFDRTFASHASYLLNYSEMNKSNVYIFGRQNRFKFAYGALPLQSNFESVQDDESFRERVTGRALLYFENHNTNGETDKPSISIIRAFSEVNGYILGFIEIQQDYSFLDKIADLGTSGDLYILDRNGEIVYPAHKLPDETVRLLREILRNGEEGYRTKDFLYTFYTSPESGLTTIVRHVTDQVFQPFYRLKNVTLTALVLVCGVSVLFIYFVTWQMTKPIRLLRARVLKFDLDNMKLFASHRSYNNEINLLNDAFQQMIDRLRRSMERELAANRAEMEARFSTLQAQIAPHFIHNVLYLISISAAEGRNQDVVNMCKRLSNMLRYMAESNHRIVTLADEMEYMMNYLTLIQYKYEDFIEIDIDVQQEAKTIPLPRLTIQPFVENAIKHAFNDSDPPWKITIICRAYERDWELIIEDNGAGMDVDKLHSLQSQISQLLTSHSFRSDSQDGTSGLGILNTVMRLKMLYADSLRFELDNGTSGGTRIHIRAALKPNRNETE